MTLHHAIEQAKRYSPRKDPISWVERVDKEPRLAQRRMGYTFWKQLGTLLDDEPTAEEILTWVYQKRNLWSPAAYKPYGANMSTTMLVALDEQGYDPVEAAQAVIDG